MMVKALRQFSYKGAVVNPGDILELSKEMAMSLENTGMVLIMTVPENRIRK